MIKISKEQLNKSHKKIAFIISLWATKYLNSMKKLIFLNAIKKYILKIVFAFISIFLLDNKSWTIWIFSFSTAVCNGALQKFIYFNAIK